MVTTIWGSDLPSILTHLPIKYEENLIDSKLLGSSTFDPYPKMNRHPVKLMRSHNDKFMFISLNITLVFIGIDPHHTKARFLRNHDTLLSSNMQWKIPRIVRCAIRSEPNPGSRRFFHLQEEGLSTPGHLQRELETRKIHELPTGYKNGGNHQP